MIYSISADNYRLNIIILLCQLFLLINRFHLLLKSGVLFDFANHYYAAAPLHLHPGPQADDHAAIVDGVAQRVDAGHRRDDDDVPPLRKRRRGRVAQAVYLVVDGAVLFDIGIGAGDIGLRLVVVVVGDEIFHGVVRKKRAELGAELNGARTVAISR